MLKKFRLYFIVIILSITTSINLFSQNCFDYTHLYDPSLVTCYYGTFSNPYSNIGVINGRHTVQNNTTETDTVTNNQMLIVPPGETTSVRLGNALRGSEAESIVYSIDVDTNNFNLLILKYAIVLENPTHTRVDQPRFTLEILDVNNQLIDNICGFEDFFASGDLGWNNISNYIIWKDWTTIGLDISQYHNQTIRVRLTSYDCSEGGHFGYAYYNLKCGYKSISQLTCGNVTDLTFRAPIGFKYSWYEESYPSNIISTSRDFTVSINHLNYICRCEYIENENCSFNLSIKAENQYPFALFDYEIDSCSKEVHFVNHSVSSYSDTIVVGPSSCEEILWKFHDGTTSSLSNITHIYDRAGVYPVILMAIMGNGACIDTTVKNIVLSDSLFVNIDFTLSDSIICLGDSINISVNSLNNYHWDSGDTTQSIIVSPLNSTYYHIFTTNKYNCFYSDSVFVNVNNFSDTINAIICRGNAYNLFGFYKMEEGLYSQNNFSVNGCDSTVYLNLKVNPSYIDTIHSKICNGEIYNLYGFNEREAGYYTHSFVTNNGCDSILNLDLDVYPLYSDTINAVICQTGYYIDNNFNCNTDGFHKKEYQTINGCDSIFNLNLEVKSEIENYSLIKDKYVVAEDFPIIVDVSCENCLNYLWNTGARDSIYYITHIGNYYVTIGHRCGNIFDSIIVVYPEVNVYLPNAFTPNENSNNTFFPIYESNEKVFIETFEIYNRWGAIIYSSSNEGWDGKYNGKYCDSGVFVWRLLYKTKYSGNKLFEKTGEVNLIY